jgi:hypothetical protein
VAPPIVGDGVDVAVMKLNPLYVPTPLAVGIARPKKVSGREIALVVVGLCLAVVVVVWLIK